ncbi:MAG: ATP-binding protein [Desulfatiglandaceae bacterium]
MPDQLAIEIKNDLAEIEGLFQALDQYGKTYHFSSKLLFDLHLVLDELLTNVIKYGYDDKGDHRIVVCLSSNPEEVVLRVEDDGRPFNPVTREAPDTSQALEQKPIGGLGIHLVKTLMDIVEYARENDKNILVIKKKLAD